MQSKAKLQTKTTREVEGQRKPSSRERRSEERRVRHFSRNALPPEMDIAHPVHYDLAQLRALGQAAAYASLSKSVSAPRRAASSTELMTEAELTRSLERMRQSQTIQLTAPVRSAASVQSHQSAPTPARASPSRLARLKALIETYIRRLLAFLRPKRTAQQTERGQAALLQLQSLFDLIGAELDGSGSDGMDRVAYQVAFGEAYYHVLQSSREHYKRHKGKQPQDENYQPYFEDFLRQMP